MGLGIVVADLVSAENLGYVEIAQDIPLESLSLTASERTGNNIQLIVGYEPALTNQRGVEFSLEGADADKFSINANGLLSIREGAENASVVVRVTSVENPSKTATLLLNGLTWQLSLIAPFEIEMKNLYTNGNKDVIAESEYDLLGDCKQWTLNLATKYKTSGNTRGQSFIDATGFRAGIVGGSGKGYAVIYFNASMYWNSAIKNQLLNEGDKITANSSTDMRVCSHGNDTGTNVVAFRRDHNTFYASVDGGQNWGSVVVGRDFVADNLNGVMKLVAPDRDYTMCAIQFSTSIENNDECLAFYNKNIGL